VSQENVEIVRELWDAFERGDIESMVAGCTADVVIVQPPEVPDRKSYIGRTAAREAVEDWPRDWEDFRVELTEITDLADEFVLSVGRNRGRGRTSGVPVDVEVFYVIRIREGKMARMAMFLDRSEALKAVGLEEWAASQENVALVRRQAQTGNDRDLAAFESTLCEDLVMRLNGGLADLQGTEFRGREAYMRWWRDVVDAIGGRVEIEAIRVAGDQVVAVLTLLASGTTSGVPVTLRFGTVYSFRGGCISAIDNYYNADDALKAVGLEE
jgi:ketosteroid isomerase-like protein